MEEVKCECCGGNVKIIYIDDEYYYECVYCGIKTDENGDVIYGI